MRAVVRTAVNKTDAPRINSIEVVERTILPPSALLLEPRLEPIKTLFDGDSRLISKVAPSC
jgi:hypothetical protein